MNFLGVRIAENYVQQDSVVQVVKASMLKIGLIKKTKMKQTKLNTGVVITYDKKGNIKTLKSPFDGDKYLKKRIFEKYY